MRDTPGVVHVEALSSLLERASFTVDALETLWGPVAGAALSRSDLVPARRALAAASGTEDRARAVLASLFVLGDPVRTEDAVHALRPLGTAALADDGIVEAGDGWVRARVDLRPYAFVDESGAGHWWIASDLADPESSTPLREDHVLGVGGATLTLTRIIAQRTVRDALDLGTGCGIQAMHASRFADRVVATDISGRALDFARFNAAVNGVGSIELRQGDLFDPVGHELFDLIVSNPPFVVTPRGAAVAEYTYRDGGRLGDALTETVLRGCAERLRAGGVAQFLGNWEYRRSATGLDRLRGWIGSARSAVPETDALVVERAVQDPAEYAETWVRDGGVRRSFPEFASLVGTWLDDFDRREVTGVGFGFVVLRRGLDGGKARTRIDVAHDAGPAGESWSRAVLAALDAEAWLSSVDDDALRSACLVVASDVTEERSYWPGADDPSVIELRKGTGWRRSMRTGSAEAALVGACDGTLSIEAIVAAIAQLLDADPGELLTAILPTVRELVRFGYLGASSS